MFITAPHAVDAKKLEQVVAEMKTLGAPTIKVVVVDGDDWQAVEGSHRIAAANHLGLTPKFVKVNPESAATGHDFQDIQDDATWQDIVDYLRDGAIGPGYKF